MRYNVCIKHNVYSTCTTKIKAFGIKEIVFLIYYNKINKFWYYYAQNKSLI